MKKIEKILSVDMETNGLWGKGFAIAAILYDNESEIARFVGRAPIEGEANEWVQNNVIPEIKDIPENYESYNDLLEGFARWYMENKEGAEVLWHMGHVVESYLFREMQDKKYIGEWDAPYAPVEVSAYLHMAGEERDSVDGYIEKYNIEKPELSGGTHNPLYDCVAAAKVFYHIQDRLMKKLDQNIKSELEISAEAPKIDTITLKI